MKQSLTRGWLAIVRDIMGASGNKTYKHSCLIAQQERFLFFLSQNINSCSSFIDCFLNSRWFCVCLPSRFCRRIYFAPPWEEWECWYRAKMFASSLAHFLPKNIWKIWKYIIQEDVKKLGRHQAILAQLVMFSNSLAFGSQVRRGPCLGGTPRLFFRHNLPRYVVGWDFVVAEKVLLWSHVDPDKQKIENMFFCCVFLC